MNDRELLRLLADVREFLRRELAVLHDSVTAPDGTVPDPEDGEELADLSRLFNRVCDAELAVERRSRTPDPLGEALNSGDGSYRP